MPQCFDIYFMTGSVINSPKQVTDLSLRMFVIKALLHLALCFVRNCFSPGYNYIKGFFFRQQEERIMDKTQVIPNIWSRVWLCNLLDIQHKSLKSQENNKLLFCGCFKRL